MHPRPGDRRAEIHASLPVAVLVVDDQGRITDVNKRGEQVLQRPAAALLGIELRNVLASTRALADSAAGGLEERARCRLRIDGEERVIGFRATEMPQTGGFTVVFQDITAWDKLRGERDRLMQLAGVSEVLPAILHELRNPLAAMAASLELMLEDAPGEYSAEDLHAVLGEVRRALLTLDGLGSVDHQLHDTRNHAVDLAIREVCRVLTGQARSRGITIHTAVENMPLLPLNRAVVRAILFNLVTNAVHAGQDGGNVWVDAELCAGLLHVEVRDDGEGMPENVRSRCREMFFTTKSKGTGIGLALCERIVRSACGSLEVDSHAGRGTTVSLNIPIAAPPRSEHPPAAVAILPKE